MNDLAWKANVACYYYIKVLGYIARSLEKRLVE